MLPLMHSSKSFVASVFFYELIYNDRSLTPLVMSISEPSKLATLDQERTILSSEVTALVNEFGPQVFPNFDGKLSTCFDVKGVHSSRL